MAWVLHEPRLVAEVPVFCLVGLKPLLTNDRAPVSVSVASAELLYHLHLRLEVCYIRILAFPYVSNDVCMHVLGPRER